MENKIISEIHRQICIAKAKKSFLNEYELIGAYQAMMEKYPPESLEHSAMTLAIETIKNIMTSK